MRIGRTLRLSQNVSNTNTLKYGTHSATGNHTGTGRSRFDENLCTAELSSLFMRNSTFQYRDTSKVLLGCLYTFGDGSSHFTSLTKAPADNTIFITNYHNGREGKRSTTLGHLGNTIDSNKSIFQLDIVRYLNSVINCHDL